MRDKKYKKATKMKTKKGEGVLKWLGTRGWLGTREWLGTATREERSTKQWNRFTGKARAFVANLFLQNGARVFVVAIAYFFLLEDLV